MAEDNLAFAATLPADQQAIIKQYAQELGLSIINSDPLHVNTKPEAWYNNYAHDISNSLGLALNRTEGKFANRESAVKFLQQEYNGLKNPSDDFPQGRDFLTRERGYDLVRAIYHISNEDLGLSQIDINKLQELTQKAWINTAQELYRDSQKDESASPDLAFQKLKGVRYSLEKAGFNLQSEEAYTLLGTTREEFDKHYQVTEGRAKVLLGSIPDEHRGELAQIRGTLAQVQLTGGTPAGFVTTEARGNRLG